MVEFDKELIVPKEAFKKEGTITTKLMFNIVTKCLKKYSEKFRKDSEILDYFLTPDYMVLPLMIYADSMDIAAVIQPGGSEGIYLDWYWHTGREGDVPVRIGTFKTLEEGMDAYRIMGEISGLLIYASWRFINRNYDSFRVIPDEE